MSGSASQVEKSCLGRQEQRSLLKKEVRKVVETVWTEPPGKGREGAVFPEILKKLILDHMLSS